MQGYNDGYNKGKEDAAKGSHRNPTPPLAKSVISDRYRQEYMNGYSKGYDDQKFKQA